MKTDKIYIWIIWFVSILLLFVISQTNLILKEETPRVYQVSFILDGEDESKYANLKKGVDDAAKKYNIDINLITLNNISQKMLIESEEENGADGIIVLAKNDLKINLIKSPVVVLKSKDTDVFDTVKMGSANPSINISKRTINIDYTDMIERLYAAFEEKYDGSSPVYVFVNDLNLAGVAKETDFLKSKQSSNIILVEGDEKEFRTAIEDLVHSKKNAYIFSLDKVSTDNICKILGGSSVYKEHIQGFYCIGATTFFLNKLNDGTIDAIATLNEYDEGYSAVEMLMADLKKTNYMTNIDMENMLVDKESLENDDIIKRLFPID